ncbi:MAG TPA: HAD-IA family hydrolase [Steroidobacteraceae bacterium]|jgi:HAD superfamily hydrolase (TIGR01509 family)
MSLAAIIFDIDGTLAETEELHRASFNLAFTDAGLPWHWDQQLYGRLLEVTGGKERLRHFIDSLPSNPLGAHPAAAIASLHAAKTTHYAGLVEHGALPLRPGFAALIEDARRAGIRLAIATTTSLPNVEALLRANFNERATTLFEVIAAGDSVTRKKPAPDIYLSVLAQMQLSACDCLAVEDSCNGLLSALAAGIATLVVRSNYTREQQFPGAALVVDDLEQARQRLDTGNLLTALQALHRRA